jgi:hypothetical protein
MIATREHLCRPNQSDKIRIEGKASPFRCWRVCDSNQQFTTVRLGEGNDSRVRVQGLQVLVQIERDFQSSAPSAGVGRHRWFKSEARDRMQANKSLAFRFDVTV